MLNFISQPSKIIIITLDKYVNRLKARNTKSLDKDRDKYFKIEFLIIGLENDLRVRDFIIRPESILVCFWTIENSISFYKQYIKILKMKFSLYSDWFEISKIESDSMFNKGKEICYESPIKHIESDNMFNKVNEVYYESPIKHIESDNMFNKENSQTSIETQSFIENNTTKADKVNGLENDMNKTYFIDDILCNLVSSRAEKNSNDNNNDNNNNSNNNNNNDNNNNSNNNNNNRNCAGINRNYFGDNYVKKPNTLYPNRNTNFINTNYKFSDGNNKFTNINDILLKANIKQEYLKANIKQNFLTLNNKDMTKNNKIFSDEKNIKDTEIKIHLENTINRINSENIFDPLEINESNSINAAKEKNNRGKENKDIHIETNAINKACCNELDSKFKYLKTKEEKYNFFISRVNYFNKMKNFFSKNDVREMEIAFDTYQFDFLFINCKEISCGMLSNIIMQNAIKKLNEKSICKLINSLNYDIVAISATKYGAYTIQKLILNANSDKTYALLSKYFKPFGHLLITHEIGNYTLQKLLKFDEKLVYNFFIENFEDIINNKLGLKVFKRCFEFFKDQKEEIFTLIKKFTNKESLLNEKLLIEELK